MPSGSAQARVCCYCRWKPGETSAAQRLKTGPFYLHSNWSTRLGKAGVSCLCRGLPTGHEPPQGAGYSGDIPLGPFKTSKNKDPQGEEEGTSVEPSLQHNQENTQYKTPPPAARRKRAIRILKWWWLWQSTMGGGEGKPAGAAAQSHCCAGWVGANTSQESRKQLRGFHPPLMLTMVALQPPGGWSWRGDTHSVSPGHHGLLTSWSQLSAGAKIWGAAVSMVELSVFPLEFSHTGAQLLC